MGLKTTTEKLGSLSRHTIMLLCDDLKICLCVSVCVCAAIALLLTNFAKNAKVRFNQLQGKLLAIYPFSHAFYNYKNSSLLHLV